MCLADYCDIMRCEVLKTQDLKAVYPESSENTDIEIWREASSYSKAVATTGPRHVAKYNSQHLQKSSKSEKINKRCQKIDAPEPGSIKGIYILLLFPRNSCMIF